MSKVLPPVNLTDFSERVKIHAASIVQIETDAQRKTLLPRLLIGLHCLKAHTLFAMVDVKKRGQGRKGKKNHLRAEQISVNSYQEWLKTTETDLKETNTYRYMSAVRGLGCDETSTEEELTTVFKTYTNPTLAALCHAAAEPVTAPTPTPQHEQLEFDLLRDCLKANRQQCEELVATSDRLKTHPELHRAAVARLYQTLHALTGHHWSPTDDPHEYATINPDQIDI
jgi:hypothetical protein